MWSGGKSSGVSGLVVHALAHQIRFGQLVHVERRVGTRHGLAIGQGVAQPGDHGVVRWMRTELGEVFLNLRQPAFADVDRPSGKTA